MRDQILFFQEEASRKVEGGEDSGFRERVFFKLPHGFLKYRSVIKIIDILISYCRNFNHHKLRVVFFWFFHCSEVIFQRHHYYDCK